MTLSGKPFAPSAMLDLAARMLADYGFSIVARNERGDSLYLRRTDVPWHLRLSNHPRTAKQRARRADILTSLVVEGTCSRTELQERVGQAVRNFEIALALKETQTSSAGSRK